MFEWHIEEIKARRAEGTLPTPLLVADGPEFLVVDGNHRARIAWDEGWSLDFDVVDANSDLQQLVIDDVRTGLPTTLEEAVRELGKAAVEHNDQWLADYSY